MATAQEIESAAREWARRVFPVLMEKDPNPDLRRDSILAVDFLTGFQVGYVLRSETKPLPVTKGLFATLNCSKSRLHGTALANLSRDSAGATFNFFDSPDGGVLLFDSDVGLHSSRLLLPNLYKWLHKFMGGPFVAGVPNRDVLIAVAETNRTALSGLPEDLSASYQGRRFPLTLKTFRVSAGGVALMG